MSQYCTATSCTALHCNVSLLGTTARYNACGFNLLNVAMLKVSDASPLWGATNVDFARYYHCHRPVPGHCRAPKGSLSREQQTDEHFWMRDQLNFHSFSSEDASPRCNVHLVAADARKACLHATQHASITTTYHFELLSAQQCCIAIYTSPRGSQRRLC